MPGIIDLMAFGVLAAAVPCAALLIVYHWWRHGAALAIERLSPLWLPFFVVTVALMVCYRSAIDRELAAWQVLTWIGYLAVYSVTRFIPRRWALAALRGLGWSVAIVCLVEYFTTGGRAGMWLQGNPNKVGGFLAVLVPLTDSWLWLIVGGAGLLATGSRGAFVGVLASVVANIAPREMADMVNAWEEGNVEKSRDLYYKMLPLFLAMFYETNPIPVKTSLALMGKIQLEMRLPLCSMAVGNLERLKKVLKDFGLIADV